MIKSLFLLVAIAFGSLGFNVSLVQAEIAHSKQSALAAAFPAATSVTEKTLFLSDTDVQWIVKRAGVECPNRVVRTYVARQGAKALGYGFIDTHRIRTFNETVLVVVSPRGLVSNTLLLAFHEPPEYKAPVRWWRQFSGRELNNKMALHQGIDSISGATMTAHAGVATTRRVLAIFERKLAPRKTALD